MSADRAERSARRRAAISYLGLSMLTGTVELGTILLAARSGWSLTRVAELGLAYQLAVLLVRPITLSTRHTRIALIASIAATIGAGWGTVFVPPALALGAVGLQGVRDRQLAAIEVPTLPKRLSRIVGFVLAASFAWWMLAVIPLIALIIDRTSAGIPSAPAAIRRPRPNRFAVLMVIHQSHYFVYSYTLLFVISGLYPGSRLVPVLIFAAGWVTYTLAPVLLDRLPTLPTLVAGHLLVVCVMVVIAGSLGSPTTVVIAWVLSGLGGGTVFCIKRLSQRAGLADDMDSWENVGHVTGATLAVVLVALLTPATAFVAAAALAATTALLGIAATVPAPRDRRERSPVVASSG